MVPDHLKPQECKRIKLREPPPVPYVPEKDKVQEEISKMRNMEIKTTIEKDTTLNFPVWQENRTRKAFLMHVTAVLDAIKKRGHFGDYDKATFKYKEASKAIASARAGLSLLEKTAKKASKEKKKNQKEKSKESEKTKEGKDVTPKATAEAPVPKAAVQEAEVAPATDDQMKANFSADLDKAKQALRIAKGAMNAAASKMFAFYLNLLSPESKYTWNKIISEQTESNPYVNLQGEAMQGPRGMLHQSFLDCVMFHLLTAFPINAAEQKKYYITNVLKKPQRVNVRQFVHQVEQLNAYIAQMPCFYYSPNANASTKPENVLFMEAELGAHVLRMCPLAWQDQYNLNERGMTPMDMCTLLTSLKAIERVCTHEKGKQEEKAEKASFNGKKGKKGQVLILRPAFPRKSVSQKNSTYARNMGVHT